MSNTKLCSKCKLELPVTKFYKDAGRSSGLRRECKSCGRRKRNREHYKEQQKKIDYKYVLKKYYGLTYEQVEEMIKVQEGKCKICEKTPITKSRRPLCIDHCHKTGKVRGLLCSKCNIGLGIFGDDIEGLEKALKYLKAAYD